MEHVFVQFFLLLVVANLETLSAAELVGAVSYIEKALC